MTVRAGEIRVLTLRQPMASAIIFGPKRVENRYANIARIPPGGFWVVIHAGKGSWPTTQQGMIDAGWADCPPIEDLPRECALGIAHLYQNIHYDPSQNSELRSNKWATGPWCLIFDEVIAFKKPFAIVGRQALWVPPPNLKQLVTKTLKAKGKL